ncbi:oxygen-independent coproporphyrinogen III oxidase [Roseivivax sp. GX 12232]|uniref:oxygen-independent coproporphyrinogen III oxidase n=1 Tax=Roseivivax sp. GX 12232 TaxID=2900547 RepID=UPI001E5999D4|nr:oxygen-independent coproporphyrinogen III oxidase [Roseivivax sp. GX 12232]MCE0504039.1 oxygen-independent coproporphyrinogen III oxidase [Roseivivax sp. GX 12232]
MTQDPLSAALLDARVPRYTSYPPADRFTTAVGAPEMARWIGAIPPGAPLSLYLHVPFCRRLCWFCACRTQGSRSDAPLDRFLAHLREEIGLVSWALPEGVAVRRLHLGGGTPSILSPGRIDRLAGWLRAAFLFETEAEVSVEIDPCDCDAARLDALMRLGMRRASIGVQDFDAQVQATIGRHQSVAATAGLVAGLRARGIASVNFDLVYGLPHQTRASLEATLDRVLELAPDRLALYGYAHVPWMAKRQRVIPEAALPGPADRLALAGAARARLEAAGYVAVGIDHFALPSDSMARAARIGTLRRNFQGYTTDDADTLIGLGPSAISSFAEGIAQNAPATGDWQTEVATGRFATRRGHALSAEDRLTAAVIAALMCQGEADLEGLAARHGAPAAPLLARAVAALTALPGIGSLEEGRLTARDASMVRLLAARLDPGFQPRGAAYSQAS